MFRRASERSVWQAGIDDLEPVCNAQICGRCDARTSISSRMHRTNHRSQDFLLDIPRGAVHIWDANSSSEIREHGIGRPIMRPFRNDDPAYTWRTF